MALFLSLSLSVPLSLSHTKVIMFPVSPILLAWNWFRETGTVFDLTPSFVFEGFTRMDKLFQWTTLWIMVEIFRTCWDLIVPKCKSL